MSFSLPALWYFLVLSLALFLSAYFLFIILYRYFLRSVFTLAYRACKDNDLSSQFYCQNLESMRLSIDVCWVLFITNWMTKGSSHLSSVCFHNLLFVLPVTMKTTACPRNPRKAGNSCSLCCSTLLFRFTVSGHHQHIPKHLCRSFAFLRTLQRLLSPSTKCYRRDLLTCFSLPLALSSLTIFRK